jgi:hypothetical protein
MMKRFGLLALCVLLAVTSLGAARATGGDDWRAREYRAIAQFRSPNSTARPGDPCVETIVNVTAEEIHRGTQGRLQQIHVDVVEYDNCVVDDFGLVREYFVIEPLNPTEFSINRAVTRARVDTRVRACDLTDDARCLDLRLKLAWDSAGALVVEGNTGWRPATATGTIVHGTVNLSPNPAGFARLEKVK